MLLAGISPVRCREITVEGGGLHSRAKRLTALCLQIIPAGSYYPSSQTIANGEGLLTRFFSTRHILYISQSMISI